LIAPAKQDGLFRLDVLFICPGASTNNTKNACRDSGELARRLFKEYDEEPDNLGFDFGSSELRYRRAAGNEMPHLFFNSEIGGRLVTVATAALALDSEVPSSPGSDYPITPGASLGGGDAYDNGSGKKLSVVLVVSVNGRALNMRTGGDWEFDESNDARSIINILYRELI
jgi:hypothetical protein